MTQRESIGSISRGQADAHGRSASRRLLLSAVAVLLVALGGCVFSDSSESISDSIGSVSDSFGSFSDSSTSSSDDDTAYRQDVARYTVASHRAGEPPSSLRQGLSEVALARGISDWEAFRATFVAVGAGLAQAGATRSELAAYRAALARPGSEDDAAIEQGFTAAAR